MSKAIFNESQPTQHAHALKDGMSAGARVPVNVKLASFFMHLMRHRESLLPLTSLVDNVEALSEQACRCVEAGFIRLRRGSDLFVWSLRRRRPSPAAEGTMDAMSCPAEDVVVRAEDAPV